MERSTFEILWYGGHGGNESAPNHVIGRDYIRRHDLTDAIDAACNALKRGRGESSYAHGMYVRVVRDNPPSATLR